MANQSCLQEDDMISIGAGTVRHHSMSFAALQRWPVDSTDALWIGYLHWKVYALQAKQESGEESLQEHQKETSAFIAQIEKSRLDKKRELSHVYARLARVEESLKMEMQAKQELVVKLAEAHKQMRQVGESMSIVSRPVTPRGTPIKQDFKTERCCTPRGDLGLAKEGSMLPPMAPITAVSDNVAP